MSLLMYICQIISRNKNINKLNGKMLLSNKLKELREKAGMPQRKIAAALDIDTATYCKFEKGTLRPKREQINILSSLLGESEDELLKYWLADKVYLVVKDEQQAGDILSVVQENMVEYNLKSK